MTHRFGASLAASHRHAAEPWWEDIYRQAFAGFQGMVSVISDGLGQRNGIDRTITLASGKIVTVDEKVRAGDYDDFFLEYWSRLEHHDPGWVEKPLGCDFIAYAFLPTGRCYLLPFPLLHLAWRQNKTRWLDLYGYRDAQNDGYTTRGCCVPIDVALDAIASAALVNFTSHELLKDLFA